MSEIRFGGPCPCGKGPVGHQPCSLVTSTSAPPTPEERAEQIVRMNPYSALAKADIATAIREAVEEEREECAKVVDALAATKQQRARRNVDAGDLFVGNIFEALASGMNEASAALRARGGKG